MFPGREVNVKLYKLAVYEAGGHFDWHMDSTHSDKHRATLLVALNTSWEGGTLQLESWLDIFAVAFFTDRESLSNLESALRLKRHGRVKMKSREIDEIEQEAIEDPWINDLPGLYSYRTGMKVGDVQATTDIDKAVEKVLAIIKGLHNNGTRKVAFALQHLYRKASISCEYLKGSDATLYDALKAVLLTSKEASDQYSEGCFEDRYVYRCDDEAESDEAESVSQILQAVQKVLTETKAKV